MSRFFRYFPQVVYNDPNNTKVLMTNLLFRLRFSDTLLNNGVNYYDYFVKDGETPEIVADKLYGDIQAHWIILFANRIVDPRYDWVLDYDNFNRYIVNKYGSIEYAKTTVHHYEKIVTTTDSLTGTVTSTRYVIDGTDPREVAGDTLPYTPYDDLAEAAYEVVDASFANGGAVGLEITKQAVYIYEYEDELNEAKRLIKVPRKEYYKGMLEELELYATLPPYYRDIRSA